MNALTRYRDNDAVASVLGEDLFRAGVVTRVKRVRTARLELADETARAGIHDLPVTSELERAWPRMGIAERRAVVRRVIDCALVAPGSKLHLDERVTICPAGTGPREVPRTNGPLMPMRGYRRRRGWIDHGHPLAQRRWWTRARLKRELREFLADKRTWPTRDEFWTAGKGTLHRQVVIQAGEAAWAHHFGFPLQEKPLREPWSEHRIRAALTLYLRGKRTWPTYQEFNRDGLGALRQAICLRGSFVPWAEEFGVGYRSQDVAGRARYWTDPRIREHLTQFCVGRTTFPTANEFDRAGEARLRAAIAKYHGPDWWADELELPRAWAVRRATANSSGASRGAKQSFGDTDRPGS